LGTVNATHRKLIVSSLLPTRSERLIDVGCGPITPSYPYGTKAGAVTCVDWKLQIFGSIPPNIEYLDGDFVELDLAEDCYDALIAADVFEHVSLERERLFIEKCVSVLKPGGYLIVTVPHQGMFAYLDPYQVKPAIHRTLWRLGLYKSTYNGNCDIRKGHKHYTVQELIEKFNPFQVLQVVYFGFLFDPLLTWATALSNVCHFQSYRIPGYGWLERAATWEFDHDYGHRSFNVAVQFSKPISGIKRVVKEA
jgi:SAM-dependent methyltransferase